MTENSFMPLDFERRLKKYVAPRRYVGVDEVHYLKSSNIGLVNKSCESFAAFLDLNDRLGSQIANCFSNKNFFNIYISPVVDLLKEINSNHTVPVLIGDTGLDDFPLPVLGKARVIGSNNITLLKLNKPRHWGRDFELGRIDEIGFFSKSQRCFWRGVPTGDWFSEGASNSRLKLFEKYHNSNSQFIDFGLSAYEASTRIKLDSSTLNAVKAWVKGFVPVREILRYAFILSLEGNDVATSLKWILASNSIPVMPAPRFESWLLESNLEDGIHYIDINIDRDDLAQKVLNWSLLAEEMAPIAFNGRAYIDAFTDLVNERHLELSVLKCFLEG